MCHARRGNPWSFFEQTIDTIFETGIIVSGTRRLGRVFRDTTLSGRRLPDTFYILTRKYGLFSVPAPSQHPRGVRRGFLLVCGQDSLEASPVTQRQREN